MTIALVQTTTGADNSPATTSAFGSATTSGNCITLFVKCTTAGAPSNVQDSKGNSYVLRSSESNPASTNVNTYVYVAENIVGGGSHTVTVTEAGSIVSIIANEWSGLAVSGAFDQESSDNGINGTPFDSGNTPTTTQANELVYGGVGENNQDDCAFAAGLTPITFVNDGNGDRMEDAYKVVSATGSYKVNGTGNQSWTANCVTLKEAPSTPVESAFRLRKDDGSESAATWFAAENTVTVVPRLQNFRVRFQADTAAALDAVSLQLEVYHEAAWHAVDTSTGPLVLSPSSNISAGGTEATTAQLTPPAGKTTSDFTAGKISDDTNPLPSVTISDSFYTEVEFCLQFTASALFGSLYPLRLTDSGDPFNEYDVDAAVRSDNGWSNVFLMVG